MFIWVLFTFIVGVVGVVVAIVVYKSFAKQPTPYSRGKEIDPLPGCSDEFHRVGGICVSKCPKDYVQRDSSTCVHQLYQDVQKLRVMLGVYKAGNNQTKVDQIQSEIDTKLEEMGNMEPYKNRTIGIQPKENQGCEQEFVWQGGICVYDCPQGYEPAELLCRRIGVETPKKTDDLIVRDNYEKSPGQFCPKNFTFDPDKLKCFQNCKPGYTGLGDICYPDE